MQPFAPSQSLISRTAVPPYGQRPGWKPASAEDFGMSNKVIIIVNSNHFFAGDGGAYPECHVAQYPLEMGRKKVNIFIDSIQRAVHTASGIIREHTCTPS